MTTKRWLYYTVMVGALPLIIRCFMLSLLVNSNWHMFINPIDFVFLGLTLNLTNLNALNNITDSNSLVLRFRENSTWWSTIAIIFLAINLGVLYLDGFAKLTVLSGRTLKLSSIVLCLTSLIYSYFIVYKLNHKEK